MPYIRNSWQMQPLNNFLNAALHFGFTMLLKKSTKEKKKMKHF